MMDDGESRLLLVEFLRAEEKRGDLCNLTDPSGPPNQSPRLVLIMPWLCQQHQEQNMPHLFKCYPALIILVQL